VTLKINNQHRESLMLNVCGDRVVKFYGQIGYVMVEFGYVMVEFGLHKSPTYGPCG